MNSYSSCAISFDSPSPFFVSSSKTCKVHVLSRIEHVAFLKAVCMPSQTYLEMAVGEERPRASQEVLLHTLLVLLCFPIPCIAGPKGMFSVEDSSPGRGLPGSEWVVLMKQRSQDAAESCWCHWCNRRNRRRTHRLRLPRRNCRSLLSSPVSQTSLERGLIGAVWPTVASHELCWGFH